MNKELLTKLNALPKSWNDVTLSDYNKLNDAGVVANEYDESTSTIDIPLSIIAALTNTPIDDLEELSYIEIATYIQSLGWFYYRPEDLKPSIKCKEISDISYAEFTQWMNLKDEPYKYVNELLPIFYLELEGKDINQISIPEINGLFFFVLKKLKKHLRLLVLSSKWKQAKRKMRNLFTKTP
jgi:hypothetical protein